MVRWGYLVAGPHGREDVGVGTVVKLVVEHDARVAARSAAVGLVLNGKDCRILVVPRGATVAAEVGTMMDKLMSVED
jgi:hypothetical protein